MLFHSADERVDVVVEGFEFSEFNIIQFDIRSVILLNYITVILLTLPLSCVA
jgi:hypothetical protein